MRAPLDSAKIESFMRSLGKRTRGAGTIYLTGGATALLHGWRPSTIDIDLKADPEPSGWFEALAFLKDDLSVNVELASPDQFIPALPGWRERSPFIVRHGSLDFHHYDLYSQALAKLERGHTRDVVDVTAMRESGLINSDRLLDLFLRIEPDLIRYPSLDPRSFRASVTRFVEAS